MKIFYIIVGALFLSSCSFIERITTTQSTAPPKIYLARSRIEVSSLTDKVIRVDGVRYDLGDRTLDDYTCKVGQDDKTIMFCETHVTKTCYCADIF